MRVFVLLVDLCFAIVANVLNSVDPLHIAFLKAGKTWCYRVARA